MSRLQKEGDIKNWAKTGTQRFTEQKEKWKRILTVGGARGKVTKQQEIKCFKINMAETQGHSDFVND